MTPVERLVDAQSARFARLDPMLPPVTAPDDGDVITARITHGTSVAGVLSRLTLRRDVLPALWSALTVFELYPLIGEHSPEGIDALLTKWRTLLDRDPPGPDSACVVTWPSRDAPATRTLLDHGLVPLSVVGVRLAGRSVPASPPAITTTIRRATQDDLAAVVRLALDELEYSALVGATVLRPKAAELKQAALSWRLDRGDPIWLAERDGVPIGMAECWFTDAAPGTWAATRLPAGRWGFVNCVSVAPDARGGGVGQDLMAVVHHELRRQGVIGTFLYYNLPNPLSSVFWARQGYRPLWTVWEVRPAGALR